MKYSITIDENNVITAMYFIGSSDEPHDAIPIEDQIANSIMNAIAPQWFKYANNALENNDVYIAEYIAQTYRQTNKATAINLLQQTDWATIADVADPKKSNPYLLNAETFVEYRNLIRPVAINPPSTLVTFSAIPDAIWSS